MLCDKVYGIKARMFGYIKAKTLIHILNEEEQI